jgi:Methyltransferase domain
VGRLAAGSAGSAVPDPDCCGIGGFFDERHARRDLAEYRRGGPDRSTRRLIDALIRRGVAGRTLIDVGGGVGAIEHELLDVGLVSATDTDLSAAYLDANRSEAERRGHADRIAFVLGDLTSVAATLDPADIVTADRVVCCYPDVSALLRAIGRAARETVALVHPPDAWWTRFAARVLNLGLYRSPLRLYIHPVGEMDRLLAESGFAPFERSRVRYWQVSVYTRPAPPKGA